MPTASDSSITSSRDGLANLLILILPPMFWAGNFVVGRAVNGVIPPLTLSFGRWLIALLCILPFAWQTMRRDRLRYLNIRWQLLLISAIGVGAFNTLIYTGLTTTTATNALLLNSFIPILIVLFGALFYHQHLSLRQGIALLTSFSGVLIIVSQGQWQRLSSLSFSQGDLIIFSAMVCWALYTLWLRRIPADIDRIGLMGMQILIGVILLLPLFVWEYLSGQTIRHFDGEVAAAFAYVGIFPSVLAYLLYNLGVDRAGAARAGLFIHLMPAFGAMLSVLFLGEHLHLYQVFGIGAIFAGIILASRRPR